MQYQTEDIISPGTVHYNTVLNSLPSAEMLKHVESMSQYSAENSTSSAQFRNTQFSILSSPNTHENSVSSAQFRQAHPSSSVSSPVVQRNSFQGSPQQNRSSAQSSPLQSRTRESSPASILYRREQIDTLSLHQRADTLSLHQRAAQNRSSLRNAQNCNSSTEPQNQLRTPQFSPMRGGAGSFESSPRTRQSSLASSELCPSSPTVQCRSSSTVQFSSPSLPASSVQEVSPLPGAQNPNLPKSQFAKHCQPSFLVPTRSSWPDPGDPR